MSGPRRAKLCSHTLALALGLSALAAGGVHLGVLAGYGVLVVACGLACLTQVRTFASTSSLREQVGTAVWFCLACVCLLQAVPLPRALLAVLAPDNADIWSRSLKPFGLPPPAFASVSLAPHRSLVEALKFASYGVVFAVSARLGRKYGVRHLAAIVFFSALAVAIVTALHQLVGAERLYGLYRPLDATSIAPLLNPNNRAGYLNLGFFCGLGLLFRSGSRSRGPLLGLGLLFIVTEILLCQSRGGTASLILGMLLVLALHRARRGSEEPFELSWRWQAAIVAIIALCGTLLVLSARQKGGLGFGDRSLEKLELLRKATQLAIDHLGLGVGRGAFGSVFSAYQAPGWPRVYEHAENFPVQWAAEWGTPISLLALGALAWSLRPVSRRRHLESPVRRCALVGCLVLLAQNLLDLGLEIPAIAAALACILGALGGAAGTAAKPPQTDRLLWGGVLLTLGCLTLSLLWGGASPGRERERLRALLASTTGAPPAEFWSALRGAVEAYPADPYFPLLGSTAALAARQNALPWAARALERGPSSGTAQVHLARALRARGATDQALGALRRAARLDPSQVDTAIRLALAWDPAAVNEVVPEGPAGASVLQVLADETSDPLQRVRWLEQALERDPTDADAHYRLAFALSRDLANPDGVVCRQRRDWCSSSALEHAARADRADSSRAAILKAQLLGLKTGAPAAEAELAGVCSRLPQDAECARELVGLALKNGSPRLPAAVNALVALGCSTSERCAQTHMSLGDQFASLGHWQSAANHYREATREMPSPGSWRALAEAARQLGQPERAEDALRRAALLDGPKGVAP